MVKPKKKPILKYVVFDTDNGELQEFHTKKELDSFLTEVYVEAGDDSTYMNDMIIIYEVKRQLKIEVIDSKVEFILKETK